jgi:hypothetical protein
LIEGGGASAMIRNEMPPFEFDVINYWSEVKLDIIKDYARAYSRIMAAVNQRMHVESAGIS